MNKKLFTAVSAALVFFLLGSCNFGFSGKETTPFDGIPDGELVTPYAGTEVLRSVRSASETDNDLVDWKVARFFAVVEKIGFESFYMWQGAKVSEKPVIIYYPESNKPRYYEFRVIKDGKEVGSITCNASKKEGDPVAYVSEMTHRVNASVARELVSMHGNLSLAAVNYPNSFVMRERDVSLESVNSEQIEYRNAKTNEVLEKNNTFIDQKIDEFFRTADEATLKELAIPKSEQLLMLEEIDKENTRYAQLWQGIDSDTQELICLSDEEIEAQYKHEKSDTPVILPQARWRYTLDSVSIKLLEPWNTRAYWSNPGGYCGPAAVSFVVLGLGEKSGCEGVPDCDDYVAIYELYKKFKNEIGTGARAMWRLRRGLSNLTDYTLLEGGHWWRTINRHIRNDELPVISLRSSKGWNAQWHYRVIIGVETDTYVKGKRWLRYRNYDFYCMHDNGNDCPNDDSLFWERKHSSYHLWIGRVVPKNY